MADLVIEILIILPVFLLWLTVVSVLVRPFGVRLPLMPFNWAKHRSTLHALTFPQYVTIVGILYFGCGVFVINMVSRYFEWKYGHGSSIISGNVLRDAVGNIFAGVIFGVFLWPARPGSSNK